MFLNLTVSLSRLRFLTSGHHRLVSTVLGIAQNSHGSACEETFAVILINVNRRTLCLTNQFHETFYQHVVIFDSSVSKQSTFRLLSNMFNTLKDKKSS